MFERIFGSDLISWIARFEATTGVKLVASRDNGLLDEVRLAAFDVHMPNGFVIGNVTFRRTGLGEWIGDFGYAFDVDRVFNSLRTPKRPDPETTALMQKLVDIGEATGLTFANREEHINGGSSVLTCDIETATGFNIGSIIFQRLGLGRWVIQESNVYRVMKLFLES